MQNNVFNYILMKKHCTLIKCNVYIVQYSTAMYWSITNYNVLYYTLLEYIEQYCKVMYVQYCIVLSCKILYCNVL